MIFVDTGAWFAVAVGNDPDHDAAKASLSAKGEALVTTDYVLAEAATLVRMRDKTATGHRLAVLVATDILRGKAALLEKVSPAELEQALEI